jgi:hypothetical protein
MALLSARLQISLYDLIGEPPVSTAPGREPKNEEQRKSPFAALWLCTLPQVLRLNFQLLEHHNLRTCLLHPSCQAFMRHSESSITMVTCQANHALTRFRGVGNPDARKQNNGWI